jgi:hypothetical protein
MAFSHGARYNSDGVSLPALMKGKRMKTLRIVGRIDKRHRLHAAVPSHVAPGPVEVVVVLLPGSDDETGAAWEEGIAREWAADWSDPREDLYTPARQGRNQRNR